MSLAPILRFGLWNAWLLMAVFLLQMLVLWLASRSAWQRSHLPVDLQRSKSDRRVSALANGAWLLALGYSLFLPLHPGTMFFIFGLILSVAGTALLARATWDFVRAPVEIPIARGAYAVSRHPMYVATLLICLGAGLAGGSWLLVLLSVVIAFCFYREAQLEEKYCLQRYGEAYGGYRRRTCRWFGPPR